MTAYGTHKLIIYYVFEVYSAGTYSQCPSLKDRRMNEEWIACSASNQYTGCTPE